MGRVAGKVALVTGAGTGLGRAAALLLAAEGAKVAVTDIDEAAVRQTAELIARDGGESLHCHHDVSKPEDWPPVMTALENRFGQLDVLVNNAGIAVAKNIEETTLEEWRRTMAVNLDGVFFGCQQAIRLMKRGRGGSIINLSSIDGIIGEAELAAYCASKGGVRTLTKAVAVHCAAAGYRHPLQLHPPRLHLDAADRELPARPWHARSGEGQGAGAASDRLSRRAERHRLHGAVPGIGRIEIRHRIGDGRRRRLSCGVRPCPSRLALRAHRTSG